MIDFNDLREEKKSDLKVVLVVIIAFLFAFYVYDLLFGSRSYMRLLDLNSEYKILEKNVKDSFIAPIISNVTAREYQTKTEAVELLTKQLTSPVKYLINNSFRLICTSKFGTVKIYSILPLLF